MLKFGAQRLRSSALLRDSAWLFGGQGLSLIVQGSYFILLARLLGTREYGVLAAVTALITLVSQYSTLGSGYVLVKYVSQKPTHFRKYWGNVITVTAICGSLLIVGLTSLAPRILKGTSWKLVFLLACSECLCNQVTLCCSQVFQAFQVMRLTAAVSLLANACRLIVVAGMLTWLHHADALQWARASLSVSLIAVGIAITIVTVRFGFPTLNGRLFFARFLEGTVFAVSGSTTAAYNDLDKAMLGHYGMTVGAGIYTMAYRVVDICSTPIRAIHAAAFPRFFRLGMGGAANTEPFARKILNKTSLIGAAAAAGMLLCSPLIPLFVGRGFSASVDALRWLCLIPLFRSFHLSAGDAITGAGFQGCRTVYQFIATAANFAMNAYLIPRYSWQGAAWASLVTDGGLGAASWITLRILSRRQCADRRLIETAC